MRTNNHVPKRKHKQKLHTERVDDEFDCGVCDVRRDVYLGLHNRERSTDVGPVVVARIHAKMKLQMERLSCEVQDLKNTRAARSNEVNS